MTERKKFEVDEYVIHPLIRGLRCVDCGAFLDEKSWFTCSICGKPVCEDCRKKHIPLCMAKTWRMVEETEEGELIPVGKAARYAL